MKDPFLNGMLTAVFMASLFQDWLGLERYIELLRAGWIDLPWWIWLAPIGYCIWQEVRRARGHSK